MKFLVMFRGTRDAFRRAEFESLTRLVRGDEAAKVPEFEETPPLNKPAQVRLNGDVFRWVELRSVQEAAEIAARSVLIRGIFVCWGHGAEYDECLRDALERDPDMEPLRSGAELTFKCVVEAFGRSYSLDQQLERIHVFSALLLKLAAKVRMREPDYELWIMEDVFPSKGHRHVMPKTPEAPRQVFLGLKVGTGGQHYVSTYTLKSRRYLGTTSMDAELAFLMANQGLVRRGSLVMDPFVGTGSVTVSAAAFGALVIGSDIDITVLRGKDGTDVASNFAQYGLPPPLATVRSDLLRTCWRDGRSQGPPWLDAVLCDPPYGIREGSRSFREYELPEEFAHNHVPATQRVRFGEHLLNLLDFAARNLVRRGRLVFWLPTTEDYTDAHVPSHAAFQLVANCEQVLTLRFRRRMITLEKVRDLGSDELASELARLTRGVGAGDPAHSNLAAKVLRQEHRREDALDLVRRP